MGEAQQLQLHIIVDDEAREENETRNINLSNQSTILLPLRVKYKWWLQIALYVLFVLVGQTVAILLGRLYYVQGGKSKWMATLMQLAGFPILLLYYFISPCKFHPTTNNNLRPESRSSLMVALVYVSLGLITAANCFLLSIGMLYLPVSTVTLISASQLGFNAFFSFFLNSQKFTPLIVNSLFLLTVSSILLVFQHDSTNPSSSGVSKVKFAVGFVCTVGGSAGCGLVLALTQLSFRKVLKRRTFQEIIDLVISQGIIATSAAMVGLFASGEWKGLKGEMEENELGKISYVMTVTWAAIAWQVFSIGAVGLIFKMSALLCNATSVLGLPVVPVLAVIFFHDQMDGLKVISMVLAIWGFISYGYQQYLDECKSATDTTISTEISKALPSRR